MSGPACCSLRIARFWVLSIGHRRPEEQGCGAYLSGAQISWKWQYHPPERWVGKLCVFYLAMISSNSSGYKPKNHQKSMDFPRIPSGRYGFATFSSRIGHGDSPAFSKVTSALSQSNPVLLLVICRW